MLSEYSCGSTLWGSQKKHSFRHLANTVATGDSLPAKVLAGIKAKQQGDNTRVNRLGDALTCRFLKVSESRRRYFSKPSLLPLVVVYSEKFKTEQRPQFHNSR